MGSAIEKLLQKISVQDRERLLAVVKQLMTGNTRHLNIVKIKTTNFYRVRVGRLRIIFHRDRKDDGIVIDNITLRNEQTYRF